MKYLLFARALVFRNSVFNFIEKTKIGKNDEYWLADSVEIMRSNGKKVNGYKFEGKRYDIGTFESLLEADGLEKIEGKKI